MSKTRAVIRGNTVYITDVFTKKIIGVMPKDKYFNILSEEEGENNETSNDIPIEHHRSPSEKRRDLLKLVGNKKKLVEKADGLDKEIAVDETEHEFIKKKHINDRYRKKKISKKPKRKVCKCKK